MSAECAALHGHLVLPPVTSPLSSPQAPRCSLAFPRPWTCCLGHRPPAQAARVGVSTSWSSRGGGGVGSISPFSSSPYLECSSWLRTVGRKKRELREEKATGQEENTTGERGQEEEHLSACLHRDQEPGNSPRETRRGLAPVFVGKAVDLVWGDLGLAATLLLVLWDPGPLSGLSCLCQKMSNTRSRSLSSSDI